MGATDLLTIVECGDPILRRPADLVDPAGLASDEMQRLIGQMRATMEAAPGVGLAAPQVGRSIQLAVLADGPERWGHLTEEERTARAERRDAEREHRERSRPDVDGSRVHDRPAVERHRVRIAGELLTVGHGRDETEHAERERQHVEHEENDRDPHAAFRSATSVRPRHTASDANALRIRRTAAGASMPRRPNPATLAW